MARTTKKRPTTKTAKRAKTSKGARSAPRRGATPPRITPCLWFDKDALAAAEFYVSVFPRSRIRKVHRAPADYPSGKKGDVFLVDFSIDGAPFQALNGGPAFHFTEAISFEVECADQEELDAYYAKLSAVPESEMCGWIKDRFGVSWQLVPRALTRLLGSRDAAKAQRVMEALLEMRRLDIAALEAAARRR